MIEFNLGLLADTAHVDSSGKLYVLGEFQYIMTAQVPARHGHLAVVARWLADIAEVRGKQNALEVEIVDGDGNPIMPRSPKLPLQFGAVGPAASGRAHSQLVLDLDGLVLPKYGAFAIHFIVNGTHNGKVSFHVAPIPSPPPPAQPPAIGPGAGQ